MYSVFFDTLCNGARRRLSLASIDAISCLVSGSCGQCIWISNKKEEFKNRSLNFSNRVMKYKTIKWPEEEQITVNFGHKTSLNLSVRIS